MSLIACTSPCVYQQDGSCTLERAASCYTASDEAGCVNFVPRSQQGRQRLPDVADLDEL